ncbi:FkbM family methyltransferase [Nitrosovibrio sp. Nv17]|jgi:FkbM family methyltransferase|uniref:FkbM family methyltransferase n=1 Tax=Nitrosovibrio sp. Nv17 TaxID=1855339 RepID=UPI000908F619|nr:FkbM family methyltransferase [Nitrosovibrio sp. Nv17]SFW16352.1 methyltransferase, FkbM family [Nitrosovibrio sp. Nv17]
MSSFFMDALSRLLAAAYSVRGGYTRVSVRGQSIRIAVDNIRTFQRARTYSIKEPDTLQWLDGFEPGSVFFDLGANIGQYSLYAAKKFGGTVQVYAFEPQCINYYLLNKNIQLNRLDGQITAYCTALSGVSGFSRLYVPKFIAGGNRSQFGKEDLVAMKRPASHVQGMFGATLDDLCEKWGLPCPNYIKIDVDGIEIPIIKGAENTLRNPRLRSVIVELGTAEEEEEAIKLFEQAGFRVAHTSTRNWGETCFVFERDPQSA